MVELKEKYLHTDGKKIQILSGAIHYFRTLPEQWEDRLVKLKNLGFNTVETYCCWNLHEPRENEFCFEGMLDVGQFLDTAAKVGLYAIVRPGPYICGEWDLGGLPAWLLKDNNIILRSCDDLYFSAAENYMKRLMQEIVPRLKTNGGNVILLAVENEYGSFSNSHKYMDKCAELLRKCGADVPVFTSDGHTLMTLKGGKAADALTGLDFGYGNGILPEYTEAFDRLSPNEPILHIEHWIGGLAHWKETPQKYPADSVALEVRQQLEKGYHLNLYMFHGGTNFGFMNGANSFLAEQNGQIKMKYLPDITSYEIDGVLTECGDITPKYNAIKKAVEDFTGERLPQSENSPKQVIGRVVLDKTASLFDNLENIGTRFEDEFPHNMEHYGQNYGYILYRCRIEAEQEIVRLSFKDVNDRAHIYFNGRPLGLIERNDDKQYIDVDGLTESGGTLELLVENQGRINYGPDMLRGDRKGICGYVYITDRSGVRQILSDWEVYTLPMNGLEKLNYGKEKRFPAFFSGTFKAETGKDCFIHLKNFTKGFVTVNGFNLGRFWNVGPQLSLYLPWPLLKEQNEITVFEEENAVEPWVEINDIHILNGERAYKNAEVVM